MEPVLLLEGDASCLLPEGELVYHTFYSLLFQRSKDSHKVQSSNDNSLKSTSDQYIIQERSCLLSHEKIYTFIKKTKRSSFPRSHQLQLLLLQENEDKTTHSNAIKIQEIPNALHRSGTGSITWEASMVMSLFFSKYPNLLYGNVLELGCGCGLGFLTWSMVSSYGYISSYTFTDSSQEVLSQCELNIRQNWNHQLRSGVCPASFQIYFQCLNWYDYEQKEDAQSTNSTTIITNTTNTTHLYDTLIASDVAYRTQDIKPLKDTILHFLKKGSYAHIFGPNDRATLQDFVMELKKDPSLMVHTDVLPVSRSRMSASLDNFRVHGSEEEVMKSCNSCVSFVHVSISHRIIHSNEMNRDLNDLD